ncbi:MAG TPA: alkaline phosphatase D family protein [Solirubrobacteraceae bacterium]
MLTRRQLVTRSGAAGAAVVLAPYAARAKLLRGGRFRQGVLSGDPTPHGITLLTLVDDVGGRGSVRLEVARDPHFRHVVARRNIATSAAHNHSVKARVEGLKPHERYWYRFETRGEHSPVGRFQTALPPDSHAPVRFAFFSCADYTHGYYNGFDLLAREDVDFVVCLGDYIYAETYHTVADGTAVRDDNTGHPATPQNVSLNHVTREARTLSDYRDKYALYRTDPALRRMHARLPMITIWDDHEVQDDYAGGAPGGGLAPYKDYSTARKRAAYKAFFEAMPFFPSGRTRIYRALRFGRNVDLILFDERQYRADQPCNDDVEPPCAQLNNPRAFLGKTQLKWAKRRLSASKATWKVIGNEVMMMDAVVTNNSYYTYDNWQGYPTEREDLLQHVRKIDDVIFITGDIHTFIAGDVRTNQSRGKNAAIEFVGGSITSQGLGEIDLDAGGGVVIKGNDQDPHTPQAIIDTLRSINPWVDQADFDHHGYAVVKASRKTFECTLKRLQTIKRRSTATLPSTGFHYTVHRGQRSIKGVNGPKS